MPLLPPSSRQRNLPGTQCPSYVPRVFLVHALWQVGYKRTTVNVADGHRPHPQVLSRSTIPLPCLNIPLYAHTAGNTHVSVAPQVPNLFQTCFHQRLRTQHGDHLLSPQPQRAKQFRHLTLPHMRILIPLIISLMLLCKHFRTVGHLRLHTTRNTIPSMWTALVQVHIKGDV